MKINSSEILNIKNLTFSYVDNQKYILKGLNLKIESGEHCAIIGSSGCGKSTLARSIIQMLPRESIFEGDILIDGIDVRSMNEESLREFRRKNIGFIYQDSIKKLNPLMTIKEHLYELFKLYWFNKSSIFIEKKIKDTFNKVGISYKKINSYPHEFSGGMRQRVCIALALALNPKLLIADEPTTSLDTFNSYEIMSHLLDLCEKFDSTLVLITHDIKLAAKWCKEVAILADGKIVEKGKIKDFESSPRSIFGKQLAKSSFNLLASWNNRVQYKEIVLEITNLRYWYRSNSSIIRTKWNKALNEVSFKLFKNEIIGIVGMSGSGKSTLGRTLVGLINNRGGNIKIFISKHESMGNKKNNQAKYIQMIFQDPFSSLNPKMTIKNILEDVYLIHNNFNPTVMRNTLIATLEKLNLPSSMSFLNSYPKELSGGQLQRVSIARALLIKPKILICDESVNMLDASVRIQILQLLKKIQEEMGLSIIFITHDLVLAKNFCNRLMVMHNGKIVEEGVPIDIFQYPKHSITRNLLKNCLH